MTVAKLEAAVLLFDFKALEKALPRVAQRKCDCLEAGSGTGVPDGPSATKRLMGVCSESRGDRSNCPLVSRPFHEMIPKFVQI